MTRTMRNRYSLAHRRGLTPTLAAALIVLLALPTGLCRAESTGAAPQDPPAEAAASGASPSAGAWLRPGARLAVISFHSLEDRQVKQAFASLVDRGLAHRLTRKPVTASDDEVRVNPRSRSARLRAVVLAGATVGGAHG